MSASLAPAKLLRRKRLQLFVDEDRRRHPVEENGRKWSLAAFARRYGLDVNHVRQHLAYDKPMGDKLCADWAERFKKEPGYFDRPMTLDEIDNRLLPLIELAANFDDEQLDDCLRLLEIIKKRP